MKAPLTCFFLILLSAYLKAQDLIILKTGDYIEAKVEGIKDSVIKYIRTNDPYAMPHTIKESKVFMIKYKNGDKVVMNDPQTKWNEVKAAEPAAKNKNNLHVIGVVGSGTAMVGGNAEFVSNNYGFGNSEQDVILNGQVGYFLTNNLAVGVDFAFENMGETSLSSFMLGPFLRYFFFGTDTFLQAECDFGNISAVDASASASSLELNLGYAAFINRNVAFEPSLFYANSSAGDVHNISSFGINLGLQIYLRK